MIFKVGFMSKEWQFRYKNAKKSELLKEFEGWDKEDLINHIMELRSVISGMEKDMEGSGDQKGQQSAKKAISKDDYKQGWSYATKIAFLLTLNDKPLTSEELEKLLRQHDSHFKDYDRPRNNLTVTLNRMVKSKRIAKIKVPGIRSLFYALPEWTEKDGSLKPAYALTIDFFK